MSVNTNFLLVNGLFDYLFGVVLKAEISTPNNYGIAQKIKYPHFSKLLTYALTLEQYPLI